MIVLGICAALIVAFVNLRDKPIIQFAEGELLDIRFFLRGPVAADPEIELVLIEDADMETDSGGLSVARLREGMATLSRLGAKAVVLDPRLMKQSAPGNKPAEAADYTAMAAAVSTGGNVIIPYVFSLTPAAGSRAALPTPVQRTAYSLFKTRDSSAVKRPVEAGGYQAPDEAILSTGTPGHVTYARQFSRSRQYAYPVVGYGGAYYPSLAMQAFLRAAGLSVANVEVNFGEGLRIDSEHLPMDSQMRLAVNYHGPGGSYRQTRFADLLDGAPEASGLQGKLIVLGFAPTARNGAFATPYDPALSEAEFLANVIDNLKRSNPLIRSQQVIVLDILLLALIGLFFALLAAARRIWTVILVSVIAAGLFVAANIQAFIAFNLWLGLTFPLLALILCAVVLVVAKQLSTRRAAALQAAQEAADAEYSAPWTFDRVAAAAPVRETVIDAEDEPQPEDDLLTLDTADEETDLQTVAAAEKPEPVIKKPATDRPHTGAVSGPSPSDVREDEKKSKPVLGAEAAPLSEEPDDAADIGENDEITETPQSESEQEDRKPDTEEAPARVEPELPAPAARPAIDAPSRPEPDLPSAPVLPAAPATAAEEKSGEQSIREKDRRESGTAGQKNKKPASLIPVMESSLRREKITLSAPTGRDVRSGGRDEAGVATLFVRMRGFRRAVKRFGPTRSVQLLHSVYQLIDKTVVRNAGYLEQFGDEDVMAIFGLPDGDARDAENCLRAARELAAALAGWVVRQEMSSEAADFCVCADFGTVRVTAGGSAEAPDISLGGYAIGRVSRMDKSAAAQGANVVVSEKLMAKVRETDLTGELKTGFVEQPMQQIPGAAEMTGLWRAVISADA